MDFTTLVDEATTESATSYSTPSISPAASKLLIAIVNLSAIAVDTDTSASGLSGTWNHIGDVRYNANYQLSAFWCANYTGSGAVTFTHSDGATHCNRCIFQVGGADLTTPIVASSFKNVASGSAASLSMTLNAAANSNNRPFAAFGNNNNTPGEATPRTNWTELTDREVLTPGGVLETQWRSDAFEMTASCAFVGGTYACGGIAFEIAAAAVGGGTTFTGWGVPI